VTGVESFDVVVVGAGLAGLHFTESICASGYRVLILDCKGNLDHRIHTTGIFVRRTLDDFLIDEDCLGPWVRRVALWSPRMRSLTLEAPAGEFRVGHMGRLYSKKLWRAIAAGASWWNKTHFLGAESDGLGSIVHLSSSGVERVVRTRLLVGADGATSRVARALGLDENRELIVGVEDVYAGNAASGPPILHCFLDPKLAPGYIAWVVNDGELVHIGVGGYAREYDPVRALDAFRSVASRVVDVAALRLIERRGGRIPVGGVLSKIGKDRGMLVGDAAGAPSPLTAGGLDACFRLSEFAAQTAARSLSGDRFAMARYRGGLFKTRFLSRRWMRRIMAAVRAPTAIEGAFGLLASPLLRGLVWRVFFGRGSFPDVSARGAASEAKSTAPGIL
jgi:flavin-dependent dehydrogenase